MIRSSSESLSWVSGNVVVFVKVALEFMLAAAYCVDLLHSSLLLRKRTISTHLATHAELYCATVVPVVLLGRDTQD